MSDADLVALVCCDLGAIVRGRAVFANELEEHVRRGVGWVPANQALTPLGGLAEGEPFGSTGDLRLMPDQASRARVDGDGDATALELLLCDITDTDGRPWECCTRSFLREAVTEVEAGLDVEVRASFEHEFQLEQTWPPAPGFSLEAQRRVDPFASRVMTALAQAGAAPERFFSEYAPHQFEIPVAASAALQSADRAVVLREVVREIARRQGLRATFAPLTDPEQAGNGVHVHISLAGHDGSAPLYDPRRPAALSELGGSFAAGILEHARALSALTAPSPISHERLQPHRWSAGAVCLGEQNRETLLRLPPLVAAGGEEPSHQMRLEYRGADATANPHLALGALLRAGLDGVRRSLSTPAILDRDPGELTGADAERYRVDGLPRSLAEALAALEEDEEARGWMTPLLLAAYVSVKRSELAATDGLELHAACARYGSIY
jgi:glutamine synthetase